MVVCPNCGEENPAKFRLCGYCGTALAPAPPPQEVRKLVTLLFCDLKGSTSLGERLDSESLREVMSSYFDAMSAAITRHGGTIEKFIGDAVMAVFGLPRVHEDDALRAVRAARAMQEALADLNVDLERRYGVRLANRIGVNTGEVVAGDPTAGQRLVTGDAVNVAARLEQAAGESEALLGELTHRLVRAQIDSEPVEPLELKGKSERVAAFRLLGLRTNSVRAPERRLVGRERELETLERTLADAAANRFCRLVVVTGDAGVGKSRLIEQFAGEASATALVLQGRCLSYGDGITFWPLVEALRQAAGIHEDDDLATARRKLEAIVSDPAVAERLASASGLAESQHPVHELFWASRRLLEILARDRPVVLVLEDLHWAEPTLLDLVDHVVANVEDAAVVVLGSARPELVAARPAWAASSWIQLDPLGPAETDRIAEGLLDGAAIAPDARRRLVEASEGNPLFLEQLLSMMVDEGLLRLDEGVWQLGELPENWLPPSIHALISARLDRLDREERAVIDPASVIGLRFPRAAVEQLIDDLLRDQVPRRLGSLADKQFVLPDGADAHRFQHAFIRESVYNGLLKRTRATLHEQFVRWADGVNGDRAIEFEEILGYHLEQAYRYLVELAPADAHVESIGADAARRLAAAGRRAFVRGDMHAATSLLLRATTLLPPHDRRRLQLYPDLGEALIQIGEFARAETLLAEAIEAAEAAGETLPAANATLVLMLARLLTGDGGNWSARAEQAANHAIALCDRAGDDAGSARAWRLLAWVRGTACRYAEAAAAFEQALAHARAAGDVRQECRASTGYALASSYGPIPVDLAVRECEAIGGRIAGDREAEAAILSVLAYLEALRGDFERSRELTARARSLLEQLGLKAEAAMMSLQASRAEFLAGDPQRAEQELRRGYEVLDRLGERYWFPSLLGLLAQAVHAQGRIEEAAELAARARDLADPDDVEAQAIWRGVRAKELAARGEHAEARAVAEQALVLLEPTDFVAQKCAALVDLSEVHRLGGAVDEARESLQRARALAEAKASRALVERVDALLEVVHASGAGVS